MADLIAVIAFVFLRQGMSIFALSNSVVKPIQDLTENAQQFGK